MYRIEGAEYRDEGKEVWCRGMRNEEVTVYRNEEVMRCDIYI